MKISVSEFINHCLNIKSIENWIKTNNYSYAVSEIESSIEEIKKANLLSIKKTPMFYEEVDNEKMALCLDSARKYRYSSFISIDLMADRYKKMLEDPDNYKKNYDESILYIANSKDFKIFPMYHFSPLNSLYDILNIKNENYFIRFYCHLGFYMGHFDKNALISFLNIFKNSNYHHDIYKYFHETLDWSNLGLKHLNFFSLYKYLKNPELVRSYYSNFISKNSKSYRLQKKGFTYTHNTYNPNHFYSRDDNISFMENYLKKENYGLLRFEQYDNGNLNSFIERNTENIRNNKYFDYFIYEEDTSYYVFGWLKLLSRLLNSAYLKNNQKEIKIFFASLKNLSKSRNFINRFTDCYFKYGIEI